MKSEIARGFFVAWFFSMLGSAAYSVAKATDPDVPGDWWRVVMIAVGSMAGWALALDRDRRDR